MSSLLTDYICRCVNRERCANRLGVSWPVGYISPTLIHLLHMPPLGEVSQYSIVYQAALNCTWYQYIPFMFLLW